MTAFDVCNVKHNKTIIGHTATQLELVEDANSR